MFLEIVSPCLYPASVRIDRFFLFDTTDDNTVLTSYGQYRTDIQQIL